MIDHGIGCGLSPGDRHGFARGKEEMTWARAWDEKRKK
jgi:hypothetical protein